MSETKHVPTYLETIAQRIWHESEGLALWYPADEAALWLGYAVLCRSKGEGTTAEDVHDMWAAWATVHFAGQHPSSVPFDELTPDVQAYDDFYRDAIHAVAREQEQA